jgi:hypothetical protein
MSDVARSESYLTLGTASAIRMLGAERHRDA